MRKLARWSRTVNSYDLTVREKLYLLELADTDGFRRSHHLKIAEAVRRFGTRAAAQRLKLSQVTVYTHWRRAISHGMRAAQAANRTDFYRRSNKCAGT